MFLLTVNRRQILRRFLFLTVLAVLAFLTSTAGRGALFTTAKPKPDAPLTRADSPDGRIALTFDATYGDTELKRLIAILDHYKVKATFFVGGTFLSLHPDDVRMLTGNGHEVGTLGMKMVNLSALSEREVTTTLRDSQGVIEKVLGEPARYFRPPHGPATEAVVRGARAAQLQTVTFSLDSEDHRGTKAAQITQRVLRNARRGDIVLLSASDWSKETAKALPDILKGLQAKGLTPVRISDLMPSEPQL